MADLWKELHVRALKTKNNDSKYLAQFARRIPKFGKGCKCKEHWIVWARKNPPTFGEKYFEWTVKGHNAINSKLGKPTYTTEQARIFYTKFLK